MMNQTTTAVKAIWTIDPAHSEIHFKVRHMMVSNVTGRFSDFEGTVETDNRDFEQAQLSFRADTNSINTDNEQRDNHLRSGDFFDAQKFPELKFSSTSFTKKMNGKYELIGDLTIRDHTRQVKLEVEYHGSVKDPYGRTKAGFEIIGAISRKDFGLKWNALTEAGGVMVSDEVKLEMNVQLILK